MRVLQTHREAVGARYSIPCEGSAEGSDGAVSLFYRVASLSFQKGQ